jgi:glycolate oxidase FAD binding subunit
MLNLPHELEFEFGNWRDWILGARLVLADGSDVKSGSHVVKSVAGYDLHRFMVGTRGSLAVCTELTLRTFPVKSLGEPQVLGHKGPTGQNDSQWYQRVPLDAFPAAWKALEGTYAEGLAKTGTIWALVNPSTELPRYPGDWVIRSRCGSRNVELTDETQIKLMKRAKQVFDPQHKLNPGEWGFL